MGFVVLQVTGVTGAVSWKWCQVRINQLIADWGFSLAQELLENRVLPERGNQKRLRNEGVRAPNFENRDSRATEVPITGFHTT